MERGSNIGIKIRTKIHDLRWLLSHLIAFFFFFFLETMEIRIKKCLDLVITRLLVPL